MLCWQAWPSSGGLAVVLIPEYHISSITRALDLLQHSFPLSLSLCASLMSFTPLSLHYLPSFLPLLVLPVLISSFAPSRLHSLSPSIWCAFLNPLLPHFLSSSLLPSLLPSSLLPSLPFPPSFPLHPALPPSVLHNASPAPLIPSVLPSFLPPSFPPLPSILPSPSCPASLCPP